MGADADLRSHNYYFPHGSELRIENSYSAQPVYLGLSLVCFCEVVT